MPIYLYEVVKTGEVIEMEHGANEAAPTTHPETGLEIRRVYTAPNLSLKYDNNRTKKLLSNENIERTGFSKYVRDPLTGRYNKEAGKLGPAQLRPKG